jgi:tetratricopeptide (TPR) repeat protein
VRRLWLAAALALGLAAAPAAAQRIQVDAENMLALSILLLEQGRSAQALAFSEALLKVDDGNAGAWVVKSRASRNLGDYGGAVAAGKAGFRAAGPGDAARFDAAMAVAQGLASGGRKFASQLWLRRAMAAAPDDAARRQAERDFAYVRARSRLWLRFDLSLRPSSNVNNGASGDTLWFYGVPLVISGDAQALSGTEAAAGVSLRYRLTDAERAKTDLTLDLRQTAVALSDQARAQAPNARGADYAFGTAEIGLARTWKLGTRGEAVAEGTVGWNSYGGSALSRFQRLSFGVTLKAADRLVIKASASAEAQDRSPSGGASAGVVTLNLGAVFPLGQADRMELTLTARDTSSSSAEIDHRLARLRADWSPGREVLGGRLALGAFVEMRDYDRSRYAAGGREDVTLGGDIGLTFIRADYMGFVPVMSLGWQETRSNVDLYDSRMIGLGLRVQSKF